MLRYLLVLAFCCTAVLSFGQGKLKGRVFEDKTRIGLAGIRVDNLNNKQTTLTDNQGWFAIPAKNGDVLALKGFAYKNDTVLVTSLADHEFFMELQTNQLNTVNVVSTTTPNMNSYYDPEYSGKTVVKHRDKNGNPDGGITIRLWYWKKDKHKRDRLERQEKLFAIMDRIREVFVPQTVGKYVPLKGEELDNFIVLYTPTVSVFADKKFSLIEYLNASYKKYEALPADKRVPVPVTL